MPKHADFHAGCVLLHCRSPTTGSPCVLSARYAGSRRLQQPRPGSLKPGPRSGVHVLSDVRPAADGPRPGDHLLQFDGWCLTGPLCEGGGLGVTSSVGVVRWIPFFWDSVACAGIIMFCVSVLLDDVVVLVETNVFLRHSSQPSSTQINANTPL